MKQIVFKPEYCDNGEQDWVYNVIEENGDRLMVSPSHWETGIAPIGIAYINQVEFV